MWFQNRLVCGLKRLCLQFATAIGGLIGSFGGPVGIAGGVVVGAIVGGVLAGIEQLVLPD